MHCEVVSCRSQDFALPVPWRRGWVTSVKPNEQKMAWYGVYMYVCVYTCMSPYVSNFGSRWFLLGCASATLRAVACGGAFWAAALWWLWRHQLFLFLQHPRLRMLPLGPSIAPLLHFAQEGWTQDFFFQVNQTPAWQPHGRKQCQGSLEHLPSQRPWT